MMYNLWLMILAVMVGGSILKYVAMNAWAAAAIDLAVMGVAYLILRRRPYIDLGKSMLFLGVITVINLLVDFGLISSLIGDGALLLFLLYLIFNRGGGNSRRPPKLRHQWHK